MKHIIDDIYKMFSDEMPEVTDEWADHLGEQIAKMLKDRLQEQRNEYKLRLSSLGSGNRKLWYSVREGIPKEPLLPATRIKFLFGDIIELMYIALVRLSGHEVTHEQEEVHLNGIKGHIDCLVDGGLVDVKSAASFSFKKFSEDKLHESDAFGYYSQLAAYAEAGGFIPAGWLVMDKQLGHLCFAQAKPQFLPDMDARSKEVIEIVKQETEPEPCAPPAPDGKSGNMKLATVCSYCAFKQHCWRESNGGHGLRAFLYSTGPRFLTNVTKLPNVPEVTKEFKNDS